MQTQALSPKAILSCFDKGLWTWIQHCINKAAQCIANTRQYRRYLIVLDWKLSSLKGLLLSFHSPERKDSIILHLQCIRKELHLQKQGSCLNYYIIITLNKNKSLHDIYALYFYFYILYFICIARNPERNPESMALYQLRYTMTMRFISLFHFNVSKFCEIIWI